MNTNDIITLAGSTEKHIEAIREKFFKVIKVQLHPNLPDFNSPDAFGVYKENGGNPLSVMGKDFMPTQQEEFLNSIINTVFECGADLDLETLQFHVYKGGRQIEFSIQLQPLSFTNAAGRFDETQNKLVFSTSYDGSKSNTISLYTWRQICSNGMMGWGMESVLKGKNTAGGKAKFLTYCDEVVKIVSEAKEYNQRLQALNAVKMDKAKIEAFKFKLLGYNAESLAKSDKPETKKVNILNRINESIELEMERTGNTAFGVLQGITYYTNHVANTSTTVSDDEYIRFYDGAKKNDKAQQLLFAELN